MNDRRKEWPRLPIGWGVLVILVLSVVLWLVVLRLGQFLVRSL